MTSHDWSDVRERLSRLAAARPARAVFGSEGHRWNLEPPLSTGELAELEKQLRVELPEEYRSFLLEAGRGGAGPSYGLFSVRRVAGRWRWEGSEADRTDLDILDQPFPHVEAFNPASPPGEADFGSPEEFRTALEEYWGWYETTVDDPRHSIGMLHLCHLGCSHLEGLVVTGPARGRMWANSIMSDEGFQPLFDDDGMPLGFARWYLRWLEEAEAQVLPSAR
ncbi:SMI1/KNR4 family protein [Streptosporangium sp. NPDC020072]|uniref:SMI1/KNR4 family protein n=1 Tax=Streptosporangium sp. NPDC020072 TaxID=3154788 RepID=UPI0034217613